MTVNVSAHRRFPFSLVAKWGLKIALAALFGFAAFGKLTARPEMVALFTKIGLGQGFRLVTGLIELAGALLLIWPRTAFYGAALLSVAMVGALIAQAGPLHGDIFHVLAIGGLCLLAAWIARPKPN
ncbi:DoxX family protein [Novosphingobium sp.]|uniref:DoxX family protein n=1 Tax=Novosphingobium sp. TaxID=1874826 RepID=UPI003BAB51D5